MFVALRDLRFAKGRFLLIGAVVALITVLVGFLSGLTGGLANQNMSAILSLPGDRVVFSAPSAGNQVGYADSEISQAQEERWARADGVESVQPIGISQTRAEAGDHHAAVAAFGVRPGFNDRSPAEDGHVTLSSSAAKDLHVQAGESITVAGTSYRVDAVTGNEWYSHTPVMEMTLGDWQKYSAATGAPKTHATVLSVTGDPDWDAVDAQQHTVSKSTLGSVTALSSFRAEIGSLLVMVVLLFGISGLVIGAFFTVWTMQRQGDIAVLKALGASTASLVRDSLGQALLVLLAGIGVGLGLVALFGALASVALPFLLSPFTTVLPGLLMVILGLAGAAFALRSVVSADPLTALGSNR